MHGRPASPRTVLRPDFRLYHSSALEVLAGLLAEQVAALPADGDWLRPDVVLVPQYSMRRWLQQVLAERLGICANLRFLTPGEFVDFALDQNLGRVPEADRLAPDTLRWHVLRELRSAPPVALSGFVAGDDPLKAWSLANALADSYEKYQAWRRDWLLDWERPGQGRNPRTRSGTDDWQAGLWRRIGRDRPHRARRIDDYLRRLHEPARQPVGLPPRLFVFACQNISPDVLQVIASQARAGTQHFYLHTPARAFWGDLERWPAYTPGDDDAFLGGEAPNPLLAAWGQAGRDFIAGLVGGESVAPSFEAAPHPEPRDDTLLGHLQRAVLDNVETSALTGAAWPRPEVERHDPSLQFHACHTRLREVQVLHDQLRALLEAEAPEGGERLRPRDIAVLAPDIDAYAPHIEAVFGGALGSAREIPYTIADASPLASAPLAAAFLRLLELPLRALSVIDVLDLLAVPAIAARFDIDDNERGALQDWLDAAGARWGFDADDRARHGAQREAAYTLEFALDRLLLGYASGGEGDVAGVAPWPELEGQAAGALDGLLRLLDTLRRANARLAEAKPPAAWARDLGHLLDELIAIRDEDDAGVLKTLRQGIAGFAHGAALARFDAPVEHALVLDHFRRELGASDARAPFLSGGVCFGRMVPMRLIPFEVICVLGMDEEAFPARDPRDPVNRLTQALETRERRVGDPSRRDADRYLFLQLFTSAGRVFYLSWPGMDPRDNSRREPSALVAELLDASVDCHATGDEAARQALREALVVRHALQPFSPAAFGAAHVGEAAIGEGAIDEGAADEGAAEGMAGVDRGDPRRFSFDARWRDAADTPLAARTEPVFAPVTLRLPAPPDASAAVVSIDRLRSTLLRPHAAYLRDGLGLRLPEDEPPLDEHEPLGAPDALEHYKLREAVFRAWLQARARPDADALQRRLLARALLAPGADGHAAIGALLDEVAPFATLALDAGFGSDERRLAVDEPMGVRLLRGVLDGVHEVGRHDVGGHDVDAHDVGDARLLRVALRAKGRHGNLVLRHGLDWLVASLLRLPMHELYKEEDDDRPRLVVRELVSPEQARAALASLIALHEQALVEPLPFLPKSGHALYTAADEIRGLRDAVQQWCGDDHTNAERSVATQMALRGRDPFVDRDAGSRERFARIARAVFGAVEHGEAFALDDLQ